MAKFIPSRTRSLVLGNLQTVDIILLKPVSCTYYIFKILCAPPKLEKFYKKWFFHKSFAFLLQLIMKMPFYSLVHLGYWKYSQHFWMWNLDTCPFLPINIVFNCFFSDKVLGLGLEPWQILLRLLVRFLGLSTWLIICRLFIRRNNAKK